MGFVKLELPCPKSSPIVASADPEPLWAFDDLLSEIKSLELQLGYSSAPVNLKQQIRSDFLEGKDKRSGDDEPFIIRVPDVDVADSDSDDDGTYDRSVVAGTRFSCVDVELSDSEESNDAHLKITCHMVPKKSVEEGILFEFEWEHETKVKEEVQCKLSSLEASQRFENERSSTAKVRLEKYIELKREMDRRLDKQYQRKIAEVMDNHLSIIQSDHEQRSQIEERRIRDDAAVENARRRERALLEEKAQQEKAKAEAEVAKIAEEAQKAAQEAAIRKAKEAAEKEAAEKEAARARELAAKIASEKIVGPEKVATSETSNNVTSNASKGMKILAADVALKSEVSRIKLYDEVCREKMMMKNSNEKLDSCGRQISKLLRQINRTQQKVRDVAVALIGIINGPHCPCSISALLFAEKVVSLCENPNASFDSTVFARAHVILLVTSKVPAVMDLLLASLHKACIYTVPKYIQPSEGVSKSNDYWKIIGYREENGRIESSESYLKRMESFMKLYAALIQTEVPGIRNPYGLNEGWAWFAQFLNNLPATRSTAIALKAFLRMAGYAMFRQYRSQFRKILNIIWEDFLPALKNRDEAKKVIVEIEEYLHSNAFLREPEGWALQGGLLSSELV